MHGRGGSVRIQEINGDEVKVYSLPEWKEEQKRREAAREEVAAKLAKADVRDEKRSAPKKASVKPKVKIVSNPSKGKEKPKAASKPAKAK